MRMKLNIKIRQFLKCKKMMTKIIASMSITVRPVKSLNISITRIVNAFINDVTQRQVCHSETQFHKAM